MFKQGIGIKIISVVALITAIALFSTGWFYSSYQERNILRQNERTMHKLVESVSQGLQSIMLTGYADVAQVYADKLKEVEDVEDFRILRTNGLEAFRDNKTIDNVNERKGEELFVPRDEEEEFRVLLENDPEFVRVLKEQKTISYREIDSKGVPYMTFLTPIKNLKDCAKCHGRDHEIRGVLKITSSMGPVEMDISKTRSTAFFIMAFALMMILSIVAFVLTRTIIKPIGAVTAAMSQAATGNLEQRIPVFGEDEIGKMAGSFNIMTDELRRTYDGLKTEQDKLTTIIRSAREGIVVTDSSHKIVLINPAAELLLGKSGEQLIGDGFVNLIDDPEQVEDWLTKEDEEPEQVEFNNLTLSIYAATIRDSSGVVIGSAALIRDITEEKRLEAELRKLSSTDGLTGLYNRRFLDTTLEHEIKRAVRYELPISVIMFDVDHFKNFNDTYGHEQGDSVLQAIAEAMWECMRKVDFPCRYGGEEFVGILPGTPLDGAMIAAERLRQYIEDMEVDNLKVTISIGVASIPPLPKVHAKAMIDAADKALYVAKNGGRNRVEIAEFNATETLEHDPSA